MSDKIVNLYPVIFPIFLIALKYILKQSIGHRITILKIIDSLIDLPFDLVFVSVSLNAAYLVKANDNESKLSVLLLVSQIIFALIIIIFSKETKELIKEEKFWIAGLYSVINYILGLGFLLITISFTF